MLRWGLLLLALVAAFTGLRVIAAAQTPPTSTAMVTPQVVVIGVTGRYTLADTDSELLARRAGQAQAGSVVVRPRYVGECAAAGWTTLGAGRRATAGGLCAPAVDGARVSDWPARQAAAAARNGDARLGTLAGTAGVCVAAVGPGAALAAARPDGTLAAYTDLAEFRRAGAVLECPITLVDASTGADPLIAELAARPDLTIIVTGIGPPEGSDDPGLQIVYRLGSTPAGWLTSASTRRTGIVVLTDLTQTLIDFGAGRPAGSAAVDGTPLQVYPASLTSQEVAQHQRAVTALSDAVLWGYLAVGALGAALFVILVLALLRRRAGPAKLILTIGTVIAPAMLLTGSVPWQEAARPGLTVAMVAWAWIGVLTGLTVLVARRFGCPAPIAAAALAVAAFTVDAALGGPMQPGSLLNSRPIFGLRWYGFGNVTFAAYATSGLLLAGYLADRFRRAGRRRAGVVGAAVIGFGVVVCQGWPSMGSDFGGVIALTPPLLWLLFALSGARVGWARLLLAGLAAAAAITLISVLDWRRGPGARSHLGNFVQRVIDGDAYLIVVRKAVASGETILSPAGLLALVAGLGLWVVIFRWAPARLGRDFHAIRPVAVAVLATAVLGTVLNDGGISVWGTATGVFAAAMAWFVVDALGDGAWDPAGGR